MADSSTLVPLGGPPLSGVLTRLVGFSEHLMYELIVFLYCLRVGLVVSSGG